MTSHNALGAASGLSFVQNEDEMEKKYKITIKGFLSMCSLDFIFYLHN